MVRWDKYDGLDRSLEVLDWVSPTEKTIYTKRILIEDHLRFNKWTDEYLDQIAGQTKIKLEPKNEDRLSDYCGQTKFAHYGKKFIKKIRCDQKTFIPYSERETTLTNFLSGTEDENSYVITEMPMQLW